jgi:hypothetical protein
MLDWVAKVFRTWFEVILWLILIVFTIIGGIIGHAFGGYRDGGGATFLGILLGILAGLIADVIGGGFIANFLSMVDNIAEIKAAVVKNELKTTGGVSSVIHSNSPSNTGSDIKATDKGNTLDNSYDPVNSGVGDILIVKNEMKLYESPLNYDSVVSVLKAGEKLQFIKAGAKVSVAGINAPMVNVKTENNKTGWCFSGFLQANKSS